ncbi:hypothetical protein [Nocardia abscessus]|uniref:hypothetical protein n=1 Tax=Nocardia abscessus TaxID=120957 RepID=UPI0024554E8D|nr:hypothetical protein [Nocardia abscessus]
MDSEHGRTGDDLPKRLPDFVAAKSVGFVLVNNEAMSSTLRLYRESAEYQELLERTLDGLTTLDDEPRCEPIRGGGERLQREVDGVIARWMVEHPEVRRAC